MIEAVILRFRLGNVSRQLKGFWDMTLSIHRSANVFGTLALLSILAGWSVVSVAAQDAKAPDYDAIVAAPDRSDGDRQADVRRQPAKMLAFVGVKPEVRRGVEVDRDLTGIDLWKKLATQPRAQ